MALDNKENNHDFQGAQKARLTSVNIEVDVVQRPPAPALDISLCSCRFLASKSDTSPALPIHSFAQHTLDKWLQKQRLELVAEARSLILAPDHDTLSVGVSLPRPTESTGPSPDSAQQPEQLGAEATSSGLNWGPEGEEGPLLAQGTLLLP